jgi:hypothetical protein
MRASEFINEALGSLALGAGSALAKVTRKLGTGASNLTSKAAPKVLSTLGGTKPTGTQTMAQVLGKGAGSSVTKKTAVPPKPGTIGTDQTNAQPVAKGDTIDSPVLGSPVKVKNVSGTDVEIEIPGMPKATLKLPKKDLGVR